MLKSEQRRRYASLARGFGVLLTVLVAGLLLLGSPSQPGVSTPLSEALDAKSAFLAKYGGRYGYGGRIDDLYTSELLPRLGPRTHYLDWTGAALPWKSQLAAALEELQTETLGNPHCASPSAIRSEQLVEETRTRLLEFFNASPDKYTLVFTRSGTGALQLLGESFPWSDRSQFRYLTSNHNSLLGIREYARQHNASFGALEEAEVEAWVASGSKGGNADSSSDGSSSQRADQDLSTNSRGLAEVPAPVIDSGSSRSRSSRSTAQGAGEQGHSRDGLSEDGITYSLFGYPAYDNYAGVKYPLAWVERVQAHSNATHVWKVVLDAAAFVPTHKLDLTSVPADFVPLSFYKLFGYPTGIGALIMRKENTGLLRKGYWGGGGVFLATSKLDWRYYQKPPHAFEHGTVAFTDIIALRHGLEVYGRLGGVEAVQRHVSAVGEYLYEQLAALKHSNGRPVVQVFGKHHMPSRREVQGGTVNFELLGPEGQVLSYKQAAQLMAEAGLHVRTGCCCNPGACYNATGVTEEEVQQLALRKGGDFSEWEWIDVERGGRTEKRPLGSIRASLGMMTRFEDAHALVDFIGRTYVDSTDTGDEQPPLMQQRQRQRRSTLEFRPLVPGCTC